MYFIFVFIFVGIGEVLLEVFRGNVGCCVVGDGSYGGGVVLGGVELGVFLVNVYVGVGVVFDLFEVVGDVGVVVVDGLVVRYVDVVLFC